MLSLHAAEACPIGAYKVIDYMGANARDVGEAFRHTARYFKLINTAVRLPIDETVCIWSARHGDDGIAPMAGAESATVLARHTMWLLGMRMLVLDYFLIAPR